MAPTRSPARSKSARRWSALLLGLATVALLSSGCRRRAPAREPDAGAREPATSPVRILYPAAPGSFVKLVAKAARALVHVYTTTPVRDGPADWLPGSDLPPAQGTEAWTARIQRALGTGFIVDPRGTIITNAHIVGDSKRPVWVELADGTTRLEARVVGRDDRTDIAVLRVTPPANRKLPALRRGRSAPLRVGEWVVALGNPFGLGHRASAGIISTLPRQQSPMSQHGVWGYLQTDANIDPGNSGGPLLNTVGEVVGLNVALKEDNASGIGFALPIDTINRLLPTLEREGKIVRAYVGMYIGPVTPAVAKRIELELPGGALIKHVIAGGPADQAGLRQGDVVLVFDKQTITEAGQLPWLATAAGVGKEVPVVVWRGGKKLTFSLRTQPMPH